jgi:hypothetical protein
LVREWRRNERRIELKAMIRTRMRMRTRMAARTRKRMRTRMKMWKIMSMRMMEMIVRLRIKIRLWRIGMRKSIGGIQKDLVQSTVR